MPNFLSMIKATLIKMSTKPKQAPDYRETVQLSAKEIAVALEKMGTSGWLIITDVSDSEKWLQCSYTDEESRRIMLDFPLLGQRARYRDTIIRFCEAHHLSYEIQQGEIVQCFLSENIDAAAKTTYQFCTDLLSVPSEETWSSR
jgi:hypothetical protein